MQNSVFGEWNEYVFPAEGKLCEDRAQLAPNGMYSPRARGSSWLAIRNGVCAQVQSHWSSAEPDRHSPPYTLCNSAGLCPQSKPLLHQHPLSLAAEGLGPAWP